MAGVKDIDKKAREAYWLETTRFTWLIVILWFVSWVGPLVLHSWLNKIVLFGFRPQYRGQSLATFPLLFNAIGN